jgi:hypothetical protein
MSTDILGQLTPEQQMRAVASLITVARAFRYLAHCPGNSRGWTAGTRSELRPYLDRWSDILRDAGAPPLTLSAQMWREDAPIAEQQGDGGPQVLGEVPELRQAADEEAQRDARALAQWLATAPTSALDRVRSAIVDVAEYIRGRMDTLIRTSTGTGLGLAIIDNVATAHRWLVEGYNGLMDIGRSVAHGFGQGAGMGTVLLLALAAWWFTRDQRG